jgi:hypothetical protein
MTRNGIRLGNGSPATLFKTGQHELDNETTEEYEETEFNVTTKSESDLASDVPIEADNNPSSQSNIPAALMASGLLKPSHMPLAC